MHSPNAYIVAGLTARAGVLLRRSSTAFDRPAWLRAHWCALAYRMLARAAQLTGSVIRVTEYFEIANTFETNAYGCIRH